LVRKSHSLKAEIKLSSLTIQEIKEIEERIRFGIRKRGKEENDQ